MELDDSSSLHNNHMPELFDRFKGNFTQIRSAASLHLSECVCISVCAFPAEINYAAHVELQTERLTGPTLCRD